MQYAWSLLLLSLVPLSVLAQESCPAGSRISLPVMAWHSAGQVAQPIIDKSPTRDWLILLHVRNTGSVKQSCGSSFLSCSWGGWVPGHSVHVEECQYRPLSRTGTYTFTEGSQGACQFRVEACSLPAARWREDME